MGAWVPPWERKRDDEPDRDFQAEAEEASAEASVSDSDHIQTDAAYGDQAVPELIDAPPELPGADEEAPAEPEPAPVEEPARSEAEALGYVAGLADTAAHFEDAPVPVADSSAPVADVPVQVEAAPVAEITPARPAAVAAPAVPAQATGPRADETGDDRTPERVVDDAELAAALEAILLVVDEPTNELKLAEVLEQPVERVTRMLDDISARYTAAGHGFDLRRAAGGWRLYTRPEYAAYVERFVLDGQSVRLTQAALETLAVVAYKQPVTRSRISAIRGVNCDGVMRTLVTRGLIEEVGTEPETGAYLYRTTALFLEKLGLNSVDQLPPLAPFLPDDVEEVLDASG
ncbi:SMC-Scp complex subunit ScpB [Actinoplanes sp. HUAS TT8]|uniref:SMC-Scp complex subunit ScpB n=1 Tax=Actinoplanes sp. HUAS TT8 TaxID=3447453 RepID=UPI003F51F33F